MRFDRNDMREIMDEIDSRYVDEAGQIEKLEKKKSRCSQIVGNVVKYALIAACLAAVIGAATLRVLKYREDHLQSGGNIVPTDGEVSGEKPLETGKDDVDGEQAGESSAVQIIDKTEEETAPEKTSVEEVPDTAPPQEAPLEEDTAETDESTVVAREEDETDE